MTLIIIIIKQSHDLICSLCIYLHASMITQSALHYVISVFRFTVFSCLFSYEQSWDEGQSRRRDIFDCAQCSWCGFVKSSVRRRTDLCNILETFIFWFVCQVMWIAQCVLASNVHSNKHLIFVDVTVVFY